MEKVNKTMYKKHKRNFEFIGLLLLVLWYIYIFRNVKMFSKFLEPSVTCPQEMFFVEETNQCVPFRNDEQEFLYNIAGSTSASAKF